MPRVRTVLLSLLVLGLCASAVPTSAASKQDKTWHIWRRASAAADAGELERASALYAKARARSPAEPSMAEQHAVVRARLGDAEGALSLLEEAARLGYLYEWVLEHEEALDALRDSPRYAALAERVRANQAEHGEQVAAARKPIDPAEAEAFPDLTTLEQAHERAEREFYMKPSEEPWDLRRARFTEKWAGAFARLAEARRGTPDREGALIGLVRLRIEEALGLDLMGSESNLAAVTTASRAFLAEFPESAHRVEARLAGVVAEIAVRVPDDFDWAKAALPRPDCRPQLAVLEELASGGTADEWSKAALGLEAICLHEVAPERAAEIREAASAYLEHEGSTYYDTMLRSELKIALWKLDGLPPFTGEGLDGRPVSLADFAGKVTLLDFWSPG